MKKEIIGIWIVFLVSSGILFSCQKKSHDEAQSLSLKEPTDHSNVILNFSLTVDQNTYLYTDYGEPPQLAIWLETSEGKFYKTVFVTHRVGMNDWIGKVDCPVALPIWEARQFPKGPSTKRPDFLAAVTGATPRGGVFHIPFAVPRHRQWRYFVEVNASGDFNRYFPYWSKEGSPDDVGNGQPSLVYSGNILAEPGQKSVPKLVGFTDQLAPVDTLNTDFKKITTAKNLISKISVEVLPRK